MSPAERVFALAELADLNLFRLTDSPAALARSACVSRALRARASDEMLWRAVCLLACPSVAALARLPNFPGWLKSFAHREHVRLLLNPVVEPPPWKLKDYTVLVDVRLGERPVFSKTFSLQSRERYYELENGLGAPLPSLPWISVAESGLDGREELLCDVFIRRSDGALACLLDSEPNVRSWERCNGSMSVHPMEDRFNPSLAVAAESPPAKKVTRVFDDPRMAALFEMEPTVYETIPRWKPTRVLAGSYGRCGTGSL